METKPLSKELQASLGATHSVRVTHADLTAAVANADQILNINVPAGALFTVVGFALPTPFKDSSDAAFNSTQVTVGDSSDADRFLTQTQINENGAEVLYKAGATSGYAYATADSVDILIESMTGKSLSNLDTGEFVLYVKRVSLVTAAAG